MSTLADGLNTAETFTIMRLRDTWQPIYKRCKPSPHFRENVEVAVKALKMDKLTRIENILAELL